MSIAFFAYTAFFVDKHLVRPYSECMETYTREQVNQLIRREQGGNSLRSLAFKWEVSAAYLSDVLLGKREPGPKILSPLGLKRKRTVTIIYTRISRKRGTR